MLYIWACNTPIELAFAMELGRSITCGIKTYPALVGGPPSWFSCSFGSLYSGVGNDQPSFLYEDV